MAVLAHPLPGYPTPPGGQFGAPRSVLQGGIHKGLDFSAPAGTPIRAAGRGVVTRSASSLSAIATANGAGNHIHLRHDDRLETRYAHLLSRFVREGQIVDAGFVIGAVGSSGMATGNHLHFETLVDGVHVDPAPLLGLAGAAAGTGPKGCAPPPGDYDVWFPVPPDKIDCGCPSGYSLQGVAPRFSELNVFPFGPYNTNWLSAARANQYPQRLTAEAANLGDEWRVACVRGGVAEGEQYQAQLFNLVLPPLLEAGLSIGVVVAAGLLLWAGVQRILRP